MVGTDRQSTQQASVARHAGTVGFFTLLSRLAGLARESVFAHLFGASHVTDAFLVAFRIPNTLRILVAEGSATVAFLPVFIQAHKEGGQAAARRIMAQASLVFPSLSALVTGIGIVFAEPIVRLYAAGFATIPGKLEQSVALVRLMFPYLVLVSFVALAMGALNARKRFASSAAAPLLFNLIYIGGMVTLGQLVDPPMLGVALGVLAGGLAQVALQAVELWRAGLLVRPSLLVGPEIRQILRLMGPAVLAVGVYQINIIVLSWLASHLEEGAVSYLWFADRLQQFPLGVIGIAIATASLPAFSDALAEKGREGLVRSFGQSMRLTLFLIVPAAAGLAALALPLVATIFQHGRLTHSQALATATALLAFAAGLPAVASIRIVSQAFYATQDTRTPVACGLVGLACNATVAPLLAQPYGHVGLALSLTLAVWLQLLMQLLLLRRHLGRLGARQMAPGAFGALAASAPMSAGVGWLASHIGTWKEGTTMLNVAALLACVAAGAAIYFGAQALLGSAELKALVAGARRHL